MTKAAKRRLWMVAYGATTGLLLLLATWGALAWTLLVIVEAGAVFIAVGLATLQVANGRYWKNATDDVAPNAAAALVFATIVVLGVLLIVRLS